MTLQRGTAERDNPSTLQGLHLHAHRQGCGKSVLKSDLQWRRLDQQC